MDFAQIIDIDRQEFVVIREEEGAIVNGRRVRGEPFRFDASGSVQQANAETIQRLGINTKTSESIVVYTDCELRTADVKRRELADVICVRDDEWRVMGVERWPQGNYTVAVCEKVGQ